MGGRPKPPRSPWSIKCSACGTRFPSLQKMNFGLQYLYVCNAKCENRYFDSIKLLAWLMGSEVEAVDDGRLLRVDLIRKGAYYLNRKTGRIERND